jgi:transposase
MAYIGVDLHTDKFTAMFKDRRESLETYYLDPDGIRKFKNDLNEDDYIILEASTPTFSFTDIIEDKVKKAIVVDPFQFKAIANSGKKTDKVDARTLARMGKYHVESGENFLPEVYKPAESIRKLRSLFTTYQLISKQITMVKNRIHSIFKQNLKPYSKGYVFDEIMTGHKPIDLDEEYKLQVEVLFDVLSKLGEKKSEIKKEILLTGELFIADIDILVSISGISVFLAIALISDYATIKRFKNAKKFSKYLRSTPRTELSNQRVKNGKTQKNGRKLSFVFMLQGIPHFITENPGTAKSYKKLKMFKGAGKARTALVRKMFVAIFYMLRDRKYYRFMNKKLHDKKIREYRDLLDEDKRVDFFS